MRFSISSKKLQGLLAATGKVISPKPVIPILGTFLFSVSGQRLTITASGRETIVSAWTNLEDVEDGGTFCIEGKRLQTLLKNMGDTNVTFQTSGGIVEIRHGKGNYSVMTIDPAGVLAPLEITKDAKAVAVDCASLAAGLDGVAFASAQDDYRPQLQGVLLDFKADGLNFVASDTRVLAKFRCPGITSEHEDSIILPAYVIPLLRGMIGREASVDCTVSGNQFVVQGQWFKLATTMLNGKYPPYDKVIPQSAPYTLWAETDAFLSAVNRLATCACSGADPTIIVKASPFGTSLTARDPESASSGYESLECEYDGLDITIGFSATYLRSVLSAIPTRKVKVMLTDGNRQALFLPSEVGEHGELTLLCMPMSIPS